MSRLCTPILGNSFSALVCILVVQLVYAYFLLVNAQSHDIPQPTRPSHVWNYSKFHVEKSQRDQIRVDEVHVRLSIGDIIGKKVLMLDLPWTNDRDPLEQIPLDRYNYEPNPVPSKNDISVSVFLGVPYAERPVSQRRFKSPQPITELPGDRPFLAFTYKCSCAQDIEKRPQLSINHPYSYQVDEDCLYLNIFSPEVRASVPRNLPVIVFFHGGNFQTGSGNDWPGHILASRGLVVVTVNYRLGAFGFMSLGDSETGNFGLMDQRAALKFVRDHISSFGGDPQAVTIVGHDSGAVSVGLHMLSPLSNGLFRAASAMSGAELSYHSIITKPALAFDNTVKLGRYLGCLQVTARDLWDCVLTRSTNDIIQAVEIIPIEYNRYLFLPTVDGKEIIANPLLMLNSIPLGVFDYPSAVPYLTGLNKMDGSEVILEKRLLGEFNDFSLVDEKLMNEFVIEYVYKHNYTMNREAVIAAIRGRYTYFPDPSDTDAIRQKFIELATDAYYTASISLSADLHSAAGSRVFMYVNNYEIGRGADQQNFPPKWMSVCHDCDLYLLFGFPFMSKHLLPKQLLEVEWTSHDRNASQLMMTIYRQFATNMNPNLPYDSSWSPFEPRRHWYMNFNYSHWSDFAVPGMLERDYRWQDVSFWNVYLESLIQFMTTTFSPFETKLRRELLSYQISIGVIVCILMFAITLMCVFGYLLFERSRSSSYVKKGIRGFNDPPVEITHLCT